ncbi:MAG: PorT family protein [Bacteroidia bacterium]|nr:PorT family protein [Bacteroidia bacterium]
MKKLILIALSIVSVNSISNAQDDDNRREKIIIGAKVGGNLSNVYDDSGEDFIADSKLGLALGAFLAIPINKFIGVQPEVLYSQKGFKASGRLLGSTYSFTRTTSFIDVPLLLAIKPSENLTLLIGPQYSFLLQQKDVFSNGTNSVQQITEFQNDDIRKNMLCATGGIDISFKYMVLGLRAGIDLQSNNVNGTSNTPRYKNTWLQATVGFRLL